MCGLLADLATVFTQPLALGQVETRQREHRGLQKVKLIIKGHGSFKFNRVLKKLQYYKATFNL